MTPTTKIITHKNLPYWLRKLKTVKYLQCGSIDKPTPDDWEQQPATLEFPLGELAHDALSTMALCGRNHPNPMPLTGKEGFNAQGIEGKVQIRKPLISALLNLRDILPEYRGRIILDRADH